MRSFLFITKDGITLDPNQKEIHNMQILGDGRGSNIGEAFVNFKCNQPYINQFAFKSVIAVEYVGNFIMNLEL